MLEFELTEHSLNTIIGVRRNVRYEKKKVQSGRAVFEPRVGKVDLPMSSTSLT